MESQASKSNKAFAVIYGILAVCFSALLLLLLFTGQTFGGPQGITLSVVAGVAAIVTTAATWVQWHDTFPYRYDVPYPTGRISKTLKAAFGSYALAMATMFFAIPVGLYAVGQSAVNAVLDYGVIVIATLTAAFFPFVWRYMK